MSKPKSPSDRSIREIADPGLPKDGKVGFHGHQVHVQVHVQVHLRAVRTHLTIFGKARVSYLLNEPIAG